jgi:hypothetical protein
MWTQIVGKTRLALAPMENHWWQVALYVTPRGLTTSAMPSGTRTFSADFDFVDHHLYVRTSDGADRAIALVPRPVADFYAEYMEALRSLDLDVRIRPVPVEVQTAIPFAEDRVHASYDADAANRCWRILVQSDRVMKTYRGRFTGKASPVHFFWGVLARMQQLRLLARRWRAHGTGVLCVCLPAARRLRGASGPTGRGALQSRDGGVPPSVRGRAHRHRARRRAARVPPVHLRCGGGPRRLGSRRPRPLDVNVTQSQRTI